jgi:ferredoxin-NADP reductase
MNTTVFSHQTLAPDLIKLVLQFDEAQSHVSGQYSVLRLPGVADQGYYSIASPASAQPKMTFLIRVGDSPLDQALAKLKVGDQVNAEAPAGNFELGNQGDALVFVAGGTGIAPMLAMLLQSVENVDPRPKRLLYGMRDETEAGFQSELASLRRAGVQIDLYIGEPVCLDSSISSTAAIYACGPKPMLEALAEQAESLGLEVPLTEPY